MQIKTRIAKNIRQKINVLQKGGKCCDNRSIRGKGCVIIVGMSYTAAAHNLQHAFYRCSVMCVRICAYVSHHRTSEDM